MRAARDRRPKLARKILAISLAPLALFLVAVYMLYDLRPGLITSKLESLVVHGRMIAFSIQDSDDVPNGKLQWLIGSSSLNRHYRESRSGIRLWPNYLLLDHPERQLEIRRKLHAASLALGENVHIELMDTVFGTTVDVPVEPPVQAVEMMSPTEDLLIGSWRELLDSWIIYPEYGRDAGDDAGGYRDRLVDQAVKGEISSDVRKTDDNNVSFTVAVPLTNSLYPHQPVVGVLVLSSDLTGAELDILRLQEGITLLALIAFAVTVFLSLWLARFITRPVRQLSRAATAVQRGTMGSRDIPDLSDRDDEIGRLSGALVRMTRSLEQRVEDGRSVAMNSAHEIRNALMGLGGAIMNLRMSEATDREEMFEAAMEGVNRVQRLADEMQDLSNLDDVLLRTPTDIVDSREVLKEHGRRAVTSADRGLTVALGPGFAGEAVPEDCLVYAVEDKLVQVVANLVLNAVSFTPPGGEITLDCRRDGDWVELSVADQGPGLPEGEEETVFEWLHKRREEGTEGGHSGIGLTVSRQIVRAFGGEIAARNIGDDPGSPRGACFTVRLPAVPERRPFLSAAAVKRALSPRPHHDGSRAGPS